MTLDYLTANGLEKYPFKDDSSLRSSDSTFTFLNNFFLDIVFVAKQKLQDAVWLSSYQNNHSASVVTLVFSSTGSGPWTVAIPYASIVSRAVFTYADYTVAIKIVFGDGFVNAMSIVDETTHVFNRTATTLATSAVIQMVPKVSAVYFFNWDNDNDTPLYDSEFETTADDLGINAGANVEFNFTGVNQIDLSVTAGAGTGLYNPCSESLVIKEIDGISPDKIGNFLFLTDNCYTETKESHGLFFDNGCTPKCTEEQLGAFAHYLNRVKNGIGTVTTYANNVAVQIKNEADRYNNEVVPIKNIPSYKLISRRYGTVPTYYYSFSCGFYNPTEADIELQLGVTTSAGIFIADKSELAVGSDNTPISSFPITANTPCHTLAVVTFVILLSYPTTASVHFTGSIGSVTINQTIAIG